MALQHFYSRVPARVSMYNRSDGFDTFAQSAGLERDFVERELASVYESKLDKNDISAVRQNEMPCVFTQCCTRSGALVQNCISYLPLDYTGERSAYLSHSLIYTEEEKKQILSAKEGTALNPELFQTDIGDFHITAADAVPNSNYPEKDYLPGKPQETAYLVRSVEPETAKSFLYALLYAICGKGRNICFKLPGEDAELSEKSLQLFNEVLAILPYQLRENLSFASYVTAPTQYANHKLRGVSSQFPEKTAKGAYIDLQTNLVVGVHHDEVVANKHLINFFYSLLENRELRAEFLTYMERAAETIPSLQNLNLKVLSSLVFLFQYSSGLFPEQEILPNDAAVYDFFCTYEKYRVALNDAYRMQSYRCLLRYPNNHQAIPKNVFAKVSRLYGAEPRAAKRICMNIVLELIHTDVMRDKLFTFIRNNYQNEDEDVKQIIIADLSRVFYGGFLQSQLLTFFSEQFGGESEASKSLILEKLLLSIRTPAVQSKILAFIDRHYESLSDTHKDSLYDTIMEMLPECDGLSQVLVRVVNDHLSGETDQRKAAIAQRLTDALESDYHRKEHGLMPVLAAQPGFCEDLIIGLAFGPWQTRKLREEYIQLLTGKSIPEKTAVLTRIFAILPEADSAGLLPEMIALYQEDIEAGDLYLWLETAQQMQALPEEVAAGLHGAVIEPAVCRVACDAFDSRQDTDGLPLLEGYAAAHPAVASSENYRIITAYHAMIAGAVRLDYPAIAGQLEILLEHIGLLPRMAEHLSRWVIAPAEQTPETVLCLQILQGILEDRVVPLGKLYRRSASRESAEEAMTLLLSVCLPMSQAGSVLEEALTASGSGAGEVVAAFADGYGKGAHHWLRSKLPEDNPFAAHLEEKIREHKAENGSFLLRLFGKKK